MDKNLHSLEQNFTSWTDDVPTCKDSGVGTCSNEICWKDGRRAQMHDFEDRSFRFHREEYSLCLYGVFDGFQGAHVADYIMKRLPAELVLGQIVPDITDEQVKELIKQVFVSIDREYFGSIGEQLASRMVRRQYEPDRQLDPDKELFVRSGCSATIAVIVENRIFLSNIGDCEAFLCYRNSESAVETELRVSRVSIDHTIDNEDERLRLQHLGYTGQTESGDSGLGPHKYTRCFGNYLVKGGYKENASLASCRDDPVIAEPELTGPILVSSDLQLLVIATRSLVEAVRRWSEREPCAELASLLSLHLASEPNSSLSSVAQSTLDHVLRRTQDLDNGEQGNLVKREDMTLLVRCFKPGAGHQAGGSERRLSSPKYNCQAQGPGLENPELRQRRRDEKTLTQSSSARPRPTRSSTTTESSGVYVAHGRELPVDEHGRIEPYVDFGPFYKLWNARTDNGVSNVPNINPE